MGRHLLSWRRSAPRTAAVCDFTPSSTAAHTASVERMFVIRNMCAVSMVGTQVKRARTHFFTILILRPALPSSPASAEGGQTR